MAKKPVLKEPKYIIGIDLGTTHCVMAYTSAQPAEGERPVIQVFPVTQLVNPGEVKKQNLLPSFFFFPGRMRSHRADWPCPGMRRSISPWANLPGVEGQSFPNRLVSSVKSWLCHAGVNRTASILPWEGQSDGRKISPVGASALYLQHLREAWNFEMAGDEDGNRFEEQDLYLTVPASFDAVARELTLKSAQTAGMEKMTLLEEPQAAFYAWIYGRKEKWRRQVKVGETILVCDVGGGTTDFSLIQVIEERGELALKRVAVGDHLLLGGDNMDLTLAYGIQAKLAAKGVKLDAWQFRALWYNCRVAKERLLADSKLASEAVTVLGRGSSLLGGVIRTELNRDEVEKILIDGFFPICGKDDYPQEKPRVGMREMGLPYQSDPAVTRHLARFLGRHVRHGAGEEEIPFPTAILFNGGVMKAEPLRQRIVEVLRGWAQGEALRELTSDDLDLAVAIGSAYFGLARRGRGVRIHAGAARPYYIGIESALPSVPGFPIPMKALCVVPFGMEEGAETEIRQKEFGLVVGEPAVFHLLSSTVRKKDQAGEIVEQWEGEIEETITMEAELLGGPGEEKGDVVPVWLQTRITEVGTLELWCVSRDETRRWKLEFNLREQGETE